MPDSEEVSVPPRWTETDILEDMSRYSGLNWHQLAHGGLLPPSGDVPLAFVEHGYVMSKADVEKLGGSNPGLLKALNEGKLDPDKLTQWKG